MCLPDLFLNVQYIFLGPLHKFLVADESNKVVLTLIFKDTGGAHLVLSYPILENHSEQNRCLMFNVYG